MQAQDEAESLSAFRFRRCNKSELSSSLEQKLLAMPHPPGVLESPGQQQGWLLRGVTADGLGTLRRLYGKSFKLDWPNRKVRRNLWMWHQGLCCAQWVRLPIFIPLFNQGMVYLLCAVKLEKVGQEGSCPVLSCFLSHLCIPCPSHAWSWRGFVAPDPVTHAFTWAISPQVEHLSRSTVVHPLHCLVAVGEW